MTVPPMIELQNAWPAAPLAAGRYKMIWDSLCESGEQQSLTHVRGDRRGAVLRIVHTSAVSIWSKESQALSKIRLISWASLLKLSAANWIVSMISHCKGICCRGILRRVRWPIMKLGRAMLGRLALAGLAQ